jgi:hypothetical protein
MLGKMVSNTNRSVKNNRRSVDFKNKNNRIISSAKSYAE